MEGYKPKIQILMATYNGERFVEDQILSIIDAAVGLNYEILISDDGSSDGTNDIVNLLASKYSQIKVLESIEKNLGPAGRFEYLMQMSTAGLIMLSDQDDIWISAKIKNMISDSNVIQKFNHNEPFLAYSDLIVVDQDLNTISKSFLSTRSLDKYPTLRRLVIENSVTGCTTLMNREFINLALPFPKNIHMHDWWMALIASSLDSLVYVDHSDIKYRQHPNNTIGIRRKSLTVRLKGLFSSVYCYQLIMNFRESTAQASLLKERLLERGISVPKDILLFLRISSHQSLRKKFMLLYYDFLPKKFLRKIGLLVIIK